MTGHHARSDALVPTQPQATKYSSAYKSCSLEMVQAAPRRRFSTVPAEVAPPTPAGAAPEPPRPRPLSARPPSAGSASPLLTKPPPPPPGGLAASAPTVRPPHKKAPPPAPSPPSDPAAKLSAQSPNPAPLPQPSTTSTAPPPTTPTSQPSAPVTPPAPPTKAQTAVSKIKPDQTPAPQPPTRTAEPKALAPQQPGALAPPGWEQAMLAVVNGERAKVGCSALTLDDCLMWAAQKHAEGMAERKFFSHEDPLDNSTCLDRARRAGYGGSGIGENIGKGHRTPEAVQVGWVESPGHYKNMISGGYRFMGTGAWVQLPISDSDSLVAQPDISHAISSTNLIDLLRNPDAAERAATLGAEVPDEWASDPYKARLLADAVESFIFLYAPAFVSASGRQWPLAPAVQHAPGLATPAGRGTMPNYDTVYSSTRTELSQAPYRVRVPPVKGRFYSLVIYDAYQNTIVSLGSAQWITDGIDLLLVGPSSPRDAVDSYRALQTNLGPKVQGGGPHTEIIEVPTDLAIVLVRTLLLNQTTTVSEPDIGPWEALKAGVSVAPYKTAVNPNATFARPPLPAVQLLNASVDPATWYAWATSVLAEFPPPPGYLGYPLSGRLKRLGLFGGAAFNFSSLPEDVRTALTWAVPIGNRLLDAGILNRYEFLQSSNWRLSTRTLGYYGNDFYTNAVTSKGYWLPNTGVDAIYAFAFQDQEGAPLSGAQGAQYSLTLTKHSLQYDVARTGWWSLIVYDHQATLVENPLKRYGVGDRTRGLVYADNGDLTLHLTSSPPRDPADLPNWLPVPDGPFVAVLRVYNPTQDYLDGKVLIEPVVKHGNVPSYPPSPSLPPTYP
ncbi:hypothetical protein HYH03_008144 [Edaphochlamys debaryana]|uniref:SCP domain-containing protein n=1 Tax=Edaphochlamys debaryana TaxID=47281 RepID=A0A835Y1R7_9CHLO|nr:hypothetical protein HYH03_008144 [Edaphochlamys debaryana]|eukprot:KAG2493627.1 hypothetical protein HYH03_008144 [Edaphochlamys debaryana]